MGYSCQVCNRRMSADQPCVSWNVCEPCGGLEVAPLAGLALAAGLPATAEVGQVAERVRELVEQLQDVTQTADSLAGIVDSHGPRIAALTRVAEAARELNDFYRLAESPLMLSLRTALAALGGKP